MRISRQNSFVQQNTVVQIDRWKNIDIQQQIVTRFDTLDSQVAKCIDGINGEGILLHSSFPTNEGRRTSGFDDIHSVIDSLASLSHDEVSEISGFIFVNEEYSTDGSIPSLQEVGKAIDAIQTRSEWKDEERR